jgi:chromosome segregation protein
MSPSGKKRPTQSGRPAPRDPRTDSASPPRDAGSVRPVARISALESELARVQQEREAEADDLAAMLVRIAETERAKVTAARAALELDEVVNGLQVQLREMRARELAGAAEWANERATAQQRLQDAGQRLEEAERRLEESKALLEGLQAGSGDAERKVQAAQHQLAQAEDAIRRAVGRAGLAERSALDGAALLQRARTELEAERAHGIVVEAKHADALRERESQHDEIAKALREEHMAAMEGLRREHVAALEENGRKHAAETAALGKAHESFLAMLQRKHDEALPALEQRHAHTLSAVREEHSAAKRSAARLLEEERSAAARARRQVTTLEASLASMRGNMTRATELLEELERREEMAATHRTRTLEQTKQALTGAGCGLPPADCPAPAPAPISESALLDEMEIDLVE